MKTRYVAIIVPPWAYYIPFPLSTLLRSMLLKFYLLLLQFPTNLNVFFILIIAVFTIHFDSLWWLVEWSARGVHYFSNSKKTHLEPWMKAYAKKLALVQENWMRNAFIIGGVQAEIGGFQIVWYGVKVFLCMWYVCWTWKTQALAKIKDHAIQSSELKRLGKIIYNTKCP